MGRSKESGLWRSNFGANIRTIRSDLTHLGFVCAADGSGEVAFTSLCSGRLVRAHWSIDYSLDEWFEDYKAFFPGEASHYKSGVNLPPEIIGIDIEVVRHMETRSTK
uniref:Uncharacterized protein n=1 Tax=Magallana gigas TaxID=29159 RepID=K1P2U0_MAGGI